MDYESNDDIINDEKENAKETQEALVEEIQESIATLGKFVEDMVASLEEMGVTQLDESEEDYDYDYLQAMLNGNIDEDSGDEE